MDFAQQRSGFQINRNHGHGQCEALNKTGIRCKQVKMWKCGIVYTMCSLHQGKVQ